MKTFYPLFFSKRTYILGENIKIYIFLYIQKINEIRYKLELKSRSTINLCNIYVF
jgi:hypothetical protein